MSRPSLAWSDPLAVSQWLGALRVTLGDHLAVVDDMLRPPRERELGPAPHRERAGEAATQLRQFPERVAASPWTLPAEPHTLRACLRRGPSLRPSRPLLP